MLNDLDYITQNNFITFNKKQYKQKKGIPQGMCVSYILSSFYYASLEDQALSFLKQSESSLNLVMRLTDDYLLITNQMSNALTFIERLYSVSVENGFRFNTKKLRASFRINVEKLSRLQDTKALNVYMQASKLFSLK